MSEAKSFADKAVELLLRSLRTVFNERVVQAVERLIVQTRENLTGEEVLLEPKLVFKSDRKINTKSTLPWMLSNEEKAKMNFSSIDFASQNTLGVGSAESEDVDIEAMVDASKKALNFLQKQIRVQSTKINSFAKTKKGELEQVRRERAIEKNRLREEALLAKSLEEETKKSAEIPVVMVESIKEPEIIIPEKPVEIAKQIPIEPEVIQAPRSVEAPLANEPSKQAKPAKPAKEPKPPKPPKPPRVKREFNFPKPTLKFTSAVLGALLVVGIAATVFLVIDRQNSSSEDMPLSETSTPTPSESSATVVDEDLLGSGSYDVDSITSDDFNNLSNLEKIAFATFFYTPDLSEDEILQVLAALEKQFRSCLGRGEARPTNCPIVEDRPNIRSIKWRWTQSVRPQFLRQDDGRIYVEVEYAATNSGLYQKGNRSVKFTDFDGGNKVALISLSNGKVSITWNP